MNQRLLSICVPVYNRKELFRHSLIAACEASVDFSDKLEIIISDNASQDDLFSIVKEAKRKYKDINIIYSRNNNNIGMANNVLKIISIASGKYCWLIGSDDFIKQGGVEKILDIIDQNKDIEFISCNYDYIFLNKILRENSYNNMQELLKDKNYLVFHKAPTWSGRVNKLDELIDPLFNNVFLGSIMTGIFKKSLWDSVDKPNIYWDSFNTFESIYPHCYIYAKAFLGKPAFYCGEPLITVGEGAREWTTERSLNFWKTSLSLIYFNTFGEIIETYKKFGLEKNQYYKCKKFTAESAGNIFLPIIIRKYILRRHINNSEFLNIKKNIKLYFLTPSFYKGIAKSILRPILKPFLNKGKS